MITIEGIESVALSSIWMLNPSLPELLLELGKRGYAVARVRPRSLGGYDVIFIEPNVVAFRKSTFILYDPNRRMITIEGSDANDVFDVFNDVEKVLKNVGSNPDRGVLFYELLSKAKAVGNKWILNKPIKVDDLLGLDLLAIPISFVSAKGDPNSKQWFQLDIRPIWTSWSDEKVRYEVILICRDSKERLVDILKNINNVLKNILERISNILIK